MCAEETEGPLCGWLSSSVNRDLSQAEEQRDSRSRKQNGPQVIVPGLTGRLFEA